MFVISVESDFQASGTLHSLFKSVDTAWATLINVARE
jgi:hypothetical protein